MTDQKDAPRREWRVVGYGHVIQFGEHEGHARAAAEGTALRIESREVGEWRKADE